MATRSWSRKRGRRAPLAVQLSLRHRHRLDEIYASLDLAGLTNRINEIQQRLIRLAAATTYS